MYSDSDEIRFRALEKSHYCPTIKNDNFAETFKLNTFNVEEAKQLVRQSEELLSHTNKYREIIIEILDILDNHVSDFLTNKHKYISFYWSGLGIVLFEITDGIYDNKTLHISLQKYKETKRDLISEKKSNRLLVGGIAGTITLATIIVGITLFSRGNST